MNTAHMKSLATNELIRRIEYCIHALKEDDGECGNYWYDELDEVVLELRMRLIGKALDV